MPYPEFFVAPMRQDLTALGFRELRTPAEVDAAVASTPGTLMIVVNSVCGCAAGRARPGVALALRHKTRPDALASVFAGFDVEATDQARAYFTERLPSSPSIALLQNGSLVYMLERHQIEGREATDIAAELTRAFDKYCAAPSLSSR
jgi:putative YphP/YqiW family bacilliredoxin